MKPPVVVIGRHCNRNQYRIAVLFKKMRTVAKIAQSSESERRADARVALFVAERSQCTGPARDVFLRNVQQLLPNIMSAWRRWKPHRRGSSSADSAGSGVRDSRHLQAGNGQAPCPTPRGTATTGGPLKPAPRPRCRRLRCVPRNTAGEFLRVHGTPKACIFGRALPPFGHGARIAYGQRKGDFRRGRLSWPKS